MNTIITSRIVPDAQRIAFTVRLFGVSFPMTLEPAIYGFASRLCPDYRGGFWRFHELSNGGFFMAPEGRDFRVMCENGFDGTLSGEAFGITVCGYAYSNLSFREDAFAETCAEHYHSLLDFVRGHRDAAAIRSAWD